MRASTQNRVVVLSLAFVVGVSIASSAWWFAPRPSPREPIVALFEERAPERSATEHSLLPTKSSSSSLSSASERVEVTPTAATPALRAPVMLRGALHGSRRRGAELEIRIYPRFDESVEASWIEEAHAAFDESPFAMPFAGASVDLSELDALEELNQRREQMRLRDFDLLASAGRGPLGVTAHADAEGRFERDLSSLLDDSRGAPLGFDLTIRHPNFAPITAFVALQERGAPVSAVRWTNPQPIVLEFRSVLDPRCLVRGVASCFDGPCSLRVEAWHLLNDRPAAMAAETTVNVSDGTFEISVPIDGRFAISVFAEGYVPQTRTIFTYDELDLWLGVITLNRGFTFAGRVDLSRHTFGGRTWVYLSRENPVLRREVLGRHGNLWIRGNFEPETSAVQTDEEGRFEITGLAEGAYEMRVGIDRNWWTQMDPVVFVRVPDENAFVKPLLAHIGVELEQGGQPAVRRALRVSGVGRSSSSSADLVSDRFGRADLWLFPGEPYLVHVAQEHGSPWVYGKVVPWTQLEVSEQISMSVQARR